MKKIFLTSGLILCMACPAMAETTDITEGVTPTCTEPYLGTTENGANVAFEPIWDPEKYTVKYYDAVGASNPIYTDPTQATYGVLYTPIAAADTAATGLTAQNESKYGYTFKGWTDSTSFAPAYNEQGNLTNGFTSTDFIGLTLDDGDDFSLYAVYKANDYQITFSCGEATAGQTAIDPISVTYDAAIATAPNTVEPTLAQCAKEGYHFTGWSCTNGITADGHNSDSVTIYNVVGNTVCTAQWSADTINLKWYADIEGAETVQGPATCTVGGSLAVPETAPDAPAGYVFKGWTVVTETTAANHAEQQTQP